MLFQTYISFVKTIIERGLLNISLLASNANQLLNSECLNVSRFYFILYIPGLRSVTFQNLNCISVPFSEI